MKKALDKTVRKRSDKKTRTLEKTNFYQDKMQILAIDEKWASTKISGFTETNTDILSFWKTYEHGDLAIFYFWTLCRDCPCYQNSPEDPYVSPAQTQRFRNESSINSTSLCHRKGTGFRGTPYKRSFVQSMFKEADNVCVLSVKFVNNVYFVNIEKKPVTKREKEPWIWTRERN